MNSLVINISSFFILLSGILMNTSIINTNGFGIPFFYISIIISLFIILSLYINGMTVFINKKIILLYLSLISSISTVIILHIVCNIGDPNSEVKQMIARIMLIIYSMVSYIILNSSRKRIIIYSSKILLKILILYGLYQYMAGIYGFPLILNFLRNNVSFSFTNEVIGGWLNTPRIFSVWSEPSTSALPIGFFLLIIIYHSKNKVEQIIWFSITLLYSFLTYSRLVWLVVFTILMIYFIRYFMKLIVKKGLYSALDKTKYIIILLIISFSFIWPYIVPELMNDLSSYGRSSSIIVGLRIIYDNIILGTGMNSFSKFENKYNYGIEFFHSEPIIHNVFISYAQQMGIIGVIFGFIISIFIIIINKNDLLIKFVMCITIVIISVFGGDIFYMPFVWLVIAIFVANCFNCAENKGSTI